MFGFSRVILPNALSNKFAFLSQYGIEFGRYLQNIDGSNLRTPLLLILILFIVLLFKNSMDKMNSFKMNSKTLLLSISIFVYSVLSLNKVTEFLYFNF